MTRVKVLLAALVVAGTAAGFAFAAGPKVDKIDLYGPLDHANCDDGTRVGTGEAGDWGFVVFKSSNDEISALISLKNAAPNATYGVFVIQPGDCYKGIDAVFTTNAQGNGKVHVSVPSVGNWAVVSVAGAIVEQEFVSGLYEH